MELLSGGRLIRPADIGEGAEIADLARHRRTLGGAYAAGRHQNGGARHLNQLRVTRRRHAVALPARFQVAHQAGAEKPVGALLAQGPVNGGDRRQAEHLLHRQR